MNWFEMLLFGGGLFLCVSLIAAGLVLPHSWYAGTMIAVGIVVGIVWVITIFQIYER